MCWVGGKVIEQIAKRDFYVYNQNYRGKIEW